MSDKDTVIKITNLVKEYKMFARKKDRLLEAIIPKYEKHTTFKALDNFSIEIKKGEILGILGKNGAGKSTLLKMITGVVQPTSGNIEIKGKISSLLELGTAFNTDLTGYENIYQHGQVMGLTDKEIKEKEKEIIDFADIGEHLNQPVKTYSSGMFARLAFACAINVDPDILIVDEALSVGDIAFQLKCFKKFESFKKAGKTVLFVSHSVSDILKQCNRTIILSDGKMIFDGGVKEGVERYKKIIVGIDPTEDDEIEDVKEEKNISKIVETKNTDGEMWKNNFVQNPQITEYGNKQAEVIDYGMFDSNGNYISTVDNNSTIILKSKTRFNQKVNDPIFTLTLKDFHGNDIAGTNTDYENVVTGTFEKDDIVICEFKTKLPVTPGKYTLSFSCTKYNENGELEVLNRKYDALLVEVISKKQVVGITRIDPIITVKKI
ncbi:MAG: ABC transporter ATP-binding protein [Clostridia bacterium]|nr:ABC transporter ATP-binding protein [Clostridia bacterium]